VSHPIILLAEDRDDDVILIRRAFTLAKIPSTLVVVSDGEEAVSYLKGEGKYSNRAEYPLPDLLLLDLNMPKLNGFEVLEWVREQSSLARLRILVLTSSEQMHDVNRAYSLGANSFLVKPLDFENFIELGRTIERFWLNASRAPEISRPPISRKPKKPESGQSPGSCKHEPD
jgi:CheY-like chemotaxis protein